MHVHVVKVFAVSVGGAAVWGAEGVLQVHRMSIHKSVHLIHMEVIRSNVLSFSAQTAGVSAQVSFTWRRCTSCFMFETSGHQEDCELVVE